MSQPAPKNNIADPKTGSVTPEWLFWLQALADGSGTASSTAGVVTEVASARTGGTTVVTDGGGASGGGLTIFNNYGTGTPNALTKWVATQVLGDSIMTESTTAVTVAGHVFATAFHGTLPSHGTTHAAGGADPIPPVTISAASRLVGRGSSSAGVAQEITLGTGLTMTGTVLDAPTSGVVGPHAATHAAGSSDPVTITEAQVTDLTIDLAAKAPLASPAFTGTPTAPTPITSDNSTTIATTAFVKAQVGAGTDEVFIGTSDPGTSFELWYDTDEPFATMPDGTTTLTITSTGTVNDLALPNKCTLVQCTNGTTLTLNGMAAGFDGQIVTIAAMGLGIVLLPHEATASSALNRYSNIATSAPTPLVGLQTSSTGGSARYQWSSYYQRWRLISHEQGPWITPPYVASDYTASAGSWTVDAGDILTMRYLLRGRTLHVKMWLQTTSVSATPAGLIRVIPGGFTAFGNDALQPIQINNAGAGGAVGQVQAGPVVMNFYSSIGGGGWSVATNTTGINATFVLEVN